VGHQEANLSKRRNNRAAPEVSHYTAQLNQKNYHRAQPEHLTLVNDNYHLQRKRIELIPKSLNQETYIDLLTDPAHHIVFATGPAGTGKTMLAVMAAIKALKEGECKKIILTRPAVGVDDEKHGFLPGDLNQKMDPWVRPLTDILREYYRPQDIASMMEDGVIEISPLAFMRGRTFKNAFIIADEFQNSSLSQAKMLLTRIGEGCKMVITGDVEQTDHKKGINGLTDICERLQKQGVKGMAVCNLDERDMQRHHLIKDILKLYDGE